MLVTIKDIFKLFAISVVACCAVFVCTLFLNYNIDVSEAETFVVSYMGRTVYDTAVLSGKIVAGITGGCLVLTAVVMLVFYLKNYIDANSKELGVLKALGYSEINVASRFFVFGISILSGCVIGFILAQIYLPEFYKMQFIYDIEPHFHFSLVIYLIILPALFYAMISVIYGYFKLKKPVICLLKESKNYNIKLKGIVNNNLSFLDDLSKNTVRRKKMLVFFVCFSAFCFSAMTQMSMSMKKLESETFSWMILLIGLILAFMTLFMSLSSVIRGNEKTIAMMKVFGYSHKECAASLLNSYRPVSYVGFVIGSIYQYVLLKVMVIYVYSSFENMPEYSFDFTALAISFAIFIFSYEFTVGWYSKRIEKVSIKVIMLE